MSTTKTITATNCQVLNLADKAYIALSNDGLDAELNKLCNLAIAALDSGCKGPAYERLRDFLGELGYELPW